MGRHFIDHFVIIEFKKKSILIFIRGGHYYSDFVIV